MVWEETPARRANVQAQKKFMNDHFDRRKALIMRKQKITPEQKAEVIRRRYEGEDPKDLALEFGITAGYIAGTLAPWNARSNYGA